jgi:RNA polymerase sigma-70 factor (ECF subfamily)
MATASRRPSARDLSATSSGRTRRRPAFDEVFEEEFHGIHRYLARRFESGAADDLTAEVFAAAFRTFAAWDDSRPVRPWLYGIAANVVKHHWRRERRMLRAYARVAQSPTFHEAGPPVGPLDSDVASVSLATALAELRREEREVLLLHAWADLSDSEIAYALSIPIGTVKSRLSRARERVRNHLDGIGKEAV